MNNEEFKEHSQDQCHGSKQNYTLKILFGPMYGCELVLPAADYFLIIKPSSSLIDKGIEKNNFNEHAVHYAKNTLYIPCETPCANVVLHLSAPADEGYPNQFNIGIHDENGETLSLKMNLNTIFSHDSIKLAIKHSKDTWSEKIILPPVKMPDTEAITRHIPWQDNRTLLKFIAFIFLLIMLFTLLFTYVYQDVSSDPQMVTLHDALAGAPEPLDIVKGRDNNIYILTRNIHSLEWVQKTIYKLNTPHNFIIMSLSKTNKYIVNELIKSGYPVLQVDDQHPDSPVFVIYRPLSESEEADLKSLVMKKLPYTIAISFILKTKEKLLKDAQQGLERLSVSYRKVKTSSGFAFIIRDTLSDNSLNSLRNFIKQYHYFWGTHFISFSINLDDNWLQNKSYVDSAHGYLFLNPRHWYFPLDNKEL